ncbi:DUF2793 domain-containing protein [uncultured Maritimibacter sp.]|jgi:hypothetical protein|uniref:DUF2793 domain-containing protein n=1 Tax=uncultured Maritimibacter sp. TaxID=991866 RepID=UPI000A8A16A4|nr:DUF2793 domain-containing protein [uncultured Maritimibacter sp.]
MSQSTPRLGLPFIQSAQAQKHVTHNEALRALDAIVQLAITEFGRTAPPSSPTEGEIYGIGTGAAGDWSGRDGQIAMRFDSGWDYLTPRAGWIAVEAGTGALHIHDGTDWTPQSVDFDNLAGVGINATADGTNRLAVSSPATLLTHEGAGHQVKVNKASSTDTASLLFQSNWSGRAEMGLAGNDAFSIKVSADGASWDEVLAASPGTSVITTANMVGTVSASPGVGDAVIETGSGANGSYTKLADGTLICAVAGFPTASGAAATWTLPASFATASYAVTASVTGTTPAVITLDAPTTGWVDVHSFDLAGADTATPIVNLIAVGRWF